MQNFEPHPAPAGRRSSGIRVLAIRVVTAGDDETARVWDVVAGQELLRLEGHANSVLSAAFSPDGSRVVTTSRDRTARIHNCELSGDLDEPLDLARSRVTRSLTPEERRRFLQEQ